MSVRVTRGTASARMRKEIMGEGDDDGFELRVAMRVMRDVASTTVMKRMRKEVVREHERED